MSEPDPRAVYDAPRLVSSGTLLDLTLGGSTDDTMDNGNNKRFPGST